MIEKIKYLTHENPDKTTYNILFYGRYMSKTIHKIKKKIRSAIKQTKPNKVQKQMPINEDEGMQLQPEDRVLLIINDNIIQSSNRFQKYGFFTFKQHGRELDILKEKFKGLEFYRDWTPHHHHGSHSKDLEKDIAKAIELKLLGVSKQDEGIRSVERYSLTVRGHRRWEKLSSIAPKEIGEINEKIKTLQKKNTYILLKYFYITYPNYAIKSKLRDILT